MPVCTLSGLRTAENAPGTSSQTQEEHSQEAHERPNKSRRRSSASDDRKPRRAKPAREPTASRAQANNRPSPIRTHTGAVEPLTPPLTGPSPRRGRYPGRVLATGRHINTTPNPRSVLNRPPTPYARRTSLLNEPEEDDWEPSIVIGRSLGENLSRVETAWRTVRQWEALYEHTRRDTPAGAGPILERLNEARRELDEVEMNEENTTPL